MRRYALAQRFGGQHITTVKRLLDPQPGMRLLEVGSGRGHLTKKLEALGTIATGIDANPEAAQNAVARDIRTMRVEEMEFPASEFDQIVAIHAIEHFPLIAEAFADMARVLKPGGQMLLIYPAEPIRGLFSVPDAIIIYRNPFRSRELHRHKLRPSEVRAIGTAAGLEHVHSEFQLFTSPQFVTVLRKPA
ncbi:MAG: class I SAM-dependent methyltransferase [Chloroflexi bacterium]|nr:class I SAM-dependent methyltransferase [Chloroflexota bacterium]